jgi:hypothetical protein
MDIIQSECTTLACGLADIKDVLSERRSLRGNPQKG